MEISGCLHGVAYSTSLDWDIFSLIAFWVGYCKHRLKLTCTDASALTPGKKPRNLSEANTELVARTQGGNQTRCLLKIQTNINLSNPALYEHRDINIIVL